MHKIEIPDTLKAKLNSFCKAFVLPDILKLCEECGLSDKETNLITRYVKSFLSFRKRGNIADVETIEGLIWNERFMNAIEDISEVYPFVMDIRREMRHLANTFYDLKKVAPWDNERYIKNFFFSTPLSYSTFSILYAYILSKKPGEEEIKKYDLWKDWKEKSLYRVNPVISLYKELKEGYEERKNRAIEVEYYSFCQCVLQFFPVERESLLEMELPFEGAEETLKTAEKWVLAVFCESTNEVPQEEETATPAPKKKKTKKKVGIVYDIILSQRTANEISTVKDNLGESFAPYQVAIEQINANYPGVFPISDAGILDALTCLYYLSDTQTSEIQPIKADADGMVYEASIYQLYGTIKGNDYKPSFEDISRFITGLDFLTYPRRVPRKVRNAKTGKEETIIISVQFLNFLNKIILPQVERDEEGRVKVLTAQELGKQKIKFRIHKALYTGFPDRTEGENNEVLYLPVETKGKERRYFLRASFEKSSSMEWTRFLFNLSSCVQMKEANLMEKVFDYKGALEQARKWDSNGIPCDRTEKRHGKIYYFSSWEEYKRRMQSKKDKPRDKKTLANFFERAKKEGEIISYTLVNDLYTWKYKEKTEKSVF